MISCILQGGLGNQLFQIAASKSLAIDLQDELYINHSICYTPNQGHQSKKYKDIFFKGILETNNIPKTIYQEEKYSYTEIPKLKNITLHGYFQSEKYFIKNKNEIINQYNILCNYEKEIIEWKSKHKINEITVGVHIRRGDYIKFSHYHVVLGIEYYKKTFQLFNNCSFIIVSDDIEWAKQNFKGENIFYSDFNDEIKDFCLLSSCHHNIIANSSFSWWASYLNKNAEKIICAPKTWFTQQANCDIKDLIPEKWIKI